MAMWICPKCGAQAHGTPEVVVGALIIHHCPKTK